MEMVNKNLACQEPNGQQHTSTSRGNSHLDVDLTSETHHPKLKLNTHQTQLARNGRTQELIARRNLSTNPTSTTDQPIHLHPTKRGQQLPKNHIQGQRLIKRAQARYQNQKQPETNLRITQPVFTHQDQLNLPPSRKKLTTRQPDNHSSQEDSQTFQ
ncbi:hypothetical protein PGT21_025758 [Puccinia graminis f. sp. tritici]|uniref:Uncharacterized protein n=1 Tax=Puccinia graminis f. sp. tritici TaxID=56615 RepID=A0A5B0QJ92_PUCGR|nr:hypothetical protein PGT21_025758 [Puccinia graminis f. sp. tritici]